MSKIGATLVVVGMLTGVACRTKLNAGSCLNNPCGMGSICDGVTQRCVAPDGGASPADGSVADGATADLTEGVDSGLSDAANGGGDVGPEIGNVVIKSPAETTYTNKAVQIQISFSAGTAVPAQVELLKNGAALATVLPPAPFNFTWDTTVETEGTYAITARATLGGQVRVSPPVSIIVDRTPPTLLTQVPAPGALDVDAHAVIQLGFSEPLSPTSVKGGTIVVAQGGVPLSGPAVLGADGMTVATKLVDSLKLMLPATLAATIVGPITDLAGNAFISPSNPSPWSWTVPSWFKSAPLVGTGPVLRVDPKRRPILAYNMQTQVGMALLQPLQLAVYEDGTWGTPFGSPTIYPDAARYGYSMALDAAGKPTLAWTEPGPDASYVHVATWTGSGWDSSYPPLDATPGATSVTYPFVRLDKAGRPVVSWLENTGVAGATDVFVARWTGAAWDHSYGHLGLSSAYVGSGEILLDSRDSPVVGWCQPPATGVATWTGNSWTLSPVLPGALSPAIALDSAQLPMAPAHVPDLRAVHLVDGQWVNQEPVIPTSLANQLARVTLAADANPVTAWIDLNGPASVGMAHWVSTSWDLRFGVFNAGMAIDAYQIPELTVDTEGRFWVAWTEGGTINVWKSNY